MPAFELCQTSQTLAAKRHTHTPPFPEPGFRLSPAGSGAFCRATRCPCQGRTFGRSPALIGPMRVLLTYVTIGRGGDAVQLLALAEAVRNRGHDVSLVGAHPIAPYTFDTVGGRVKSLIRRLPWWVRDLLEFGFTLRATWRASRAVGRQGIDVIIHRASVYDAGAAYLARHLRVPLVLYLDTHVEVERAFRGEGYWRALHARAM